MKDRCAPSIDPSQMNDRLTARFIPSVHRLPDHLTLMRAQCLLMALSGRSADRVARSGSGGKRTCVQCPLMTPIGPKEEPSGQLDLQHRRTKPRGLLDKMLHLGYSSVLVSFNLIYQLVTKNQYPIISITKESF